MRRGLTARLAAGVATLGCAAALAFGGLQLGEHAVAPSPGAGLAFSQVSGTERQQFLERNLWLPGGALLAAATTFEVQRFLGQNLWLPGGGVPPVASSGHAPAPVCRT